MKRYYAYIRVSTTKQGEKGSSLQEQRSAIENYARRFDLSIVGWFEEQETAAARGRLLFSEMLSGLRRGKADGVIIHKIDRSARNLRDWADLGELIDQGIDVHFANESLDMTSRGGRLSADIQAVVAADYIRNLKEEVRKGFDGRLKQGLYPLPAPLGYSNEGGGKPKLIDPMSGPFVRLAFELYATGRYSLETLGDELFARGLRTRSGMRVSRTRLSDMLNNQFYIGIIQIKGAGECFQGVHEPLVSASLFRRVQGILAGRAKRRGSTHEYLYRKTVHCDQCERALVPELQKGHVYYRCHGRSCVGVCVREEHIGEGIHAALQRLVLTEEDLSDVAEELKLHVGSVTVNTVQKQEAIQLKLANLGARLERLTDAFVDRLIEKDVFEQRKVGLLKERALMREVLAKVQAGHDGIASRLNELFEPLKTLQNKAIWGNQHEMRDLVKNMSSNLQLSGKSLVVTWRNLFNIIASREVFTNSGPSRNTCRTPKKRAARADSKRHGLKLAQAILEELEKEDSAALDHPPHSPSTHSVTLSKHTDNV